MKLKALQQALDQQACELLDQHQAEPDNPSHLRAFNDWRGLSDEHALAARRAEKRSPPLDSSATGLEPERRRTPVRPRRLGRALLLASLITLIGLTLTQQYLPLAVLYADYSTRVGEQQRITLADGSHITLNSGTALSVRLEPDHRTITLHQGEALFEVHHDAERPFTVFSGNSEIRALGTIFNVHQQAGTTVTVRQGRVVLRNRNQPIPSHILHPDQQASLDSQLSPVTRVNSMEQLAWQQGFLVVHNTPLGNLATALERYLPGRVIITDTTLARQPVSGFFDIRQPDALIDTLGQRLDARLIELPLLTLILPPQTPINNAP